MSRIAAILWGHIEANAYALYVMVRSRRSAQVCVGYGDDGRCIGVWVITGKTHWSNPERMFYVDKESLE